MAQARALGASPQMWGMNPARFWRIYSSDLPRAQHTTQILLQSLWRNHDLAASRSDDNDTNKAEDANTIIVSNVASLSQIMQQVIYDERLRELAKGARQKLSKDITYDEALLLRQQKISTGEWPDEPIPALETVEDGWKRAVDWLNELILDALQQAQHDNRDEGGNNGLHVLVVSHAGFLRVLLNQLIGVHRLRAHPDSTYDPIDGRFAVPNTSLTILKLSCSDNPGGSGATNEWSKDIPAISSIDITLLTSTKHYQAIMHEDTIVR